MSEGLEGGLPSQRERRLLLAVLEDAIRTYQRYAFARDRRGIAQLAQVEEWFASDDADWTFSFVAICDALGLETTSLRAGIRRLRERGETAHVAREPLRLCGSRRVGGTRHRTVRRTRDELGAT